MNLVSPGLGERNFKPLVPVRKDGACSLKRHFRGVPRQIIGYIDLLASRDPERFVWASTSDIARHCKNYSGSASTVHVSKSGDPYSLRVVKQWKKVLREQGIISGRVKRIRGGAEREGFIVAHHDQVAIGSTDGADCVLEFGFLPDVFADLAATSEQSANAGSPAMPSGSRPGSLPGSPPSSPLSDSRFTPGFTGRFTSGSAQRSTESSEYGQSQEVLQKFGESFVDAKLLNSETAKQKQETSSIAASAPAIAVREETATPTCQEEEEYAARKAKLEEQKAILRARGYDIPLTPAASLAASATA